MKLVAVFLMAGLGACTTKPDGLALVGGGLVDTTQMLLTDDSIILLRGEFVRVSGHRSVTPLPAAAEKVDMKGRVVCPMPASIDESQMDTPALTMEKFLEQVTNRRPLIVGVPIDSSTWERSILALMRAQRVVIAPQLWKIKPGPDMERAKKNTKILLDEEIRIIVFPGAAAEQEMALLSTAGLDNKQLVRAYLQNSSLAAGSNASLLVLLGNPLDSWRNLFKVERKMILGKWQAGA